MLPEHVFPPYPTWQRHLKPLSVSKQVPPFWQVSVWHGLLSVEEILRWATTNQNGYILWKRDRLTKWGDYLFAVLDTENDYFHLLSNLYKTALPDIAVTGQLPNIFSCLIFSAKFDLYIAVTLYITVTLPWDGRACWDEGESERFHLISYFISPPYFFSSSLIITSRSTPLSQGRI